MENQASYEIDPQTQGSTALVEVEQQRAIAETQAAMIIAKRFPRNVIQVRDRIKDICSRPKLAAQAKYQYARGGTDIEGPSIRLSEAVAQCWGNMQYGIRELDRRGDSSTVEAFAWDIESNVRQTKTFSVPHVRHTKKGAYNLEDPRDIYEAVANQGARRLRSCILGIIPGDIVQEAEEQCEATLKASTKITPEIIKSLIEKFDVLGVTKDQIEKRIQRRVDTITAALMINLGKIYNSIKDGMSAPTDWFEVAPEKGATESLKEKLKAKEPKPESAVTPEQLTRIEELYKLVPEASQFDALFEAGIGEIADVHTSEQADKLIKALEVRAKKGK